MAAQMSTPTPGFTCMTCRLRFQSRVDMKKHFESAFHQHNMQLKLKSLPPVSFAKYQAETKGVAAGAERVLQYRCKICRKSYGSVQTLSSHLKSAKHIAAKAKHMQDRDGQLSGSDSDGGAAPVRRRVAQAAPESDTESDASQEAEELPAATEGSCLFCPEESDNLDAAMLHMKDAHCFEPPQQQRLHDRAGLLAYLHRKVRGGICLHCNSANKSFQSVQAVRSHMQSKSHCAMQWLDNEGEYAEFYTQQECTTVVPEVNEFGAATLNGRVVTTRDTVYHSHRPQLAIPLPGQDVDGPNRQLAIAAGKGHMTVAAVQRQKEQLAYNKNPVVAKSQKRAIEVNAKKWERLGTDHNPAAFHGYMI